MNKTIIVILLMLFSSVIFAQDPEPITVFKKHFKFRAGLTLKYGFVKGDIIILNYKVLDEKGIKEVKVRTLSGDKLLYHSEGKVMGTVYQYEMLKDDILYFFFRAPRLKNREVNIEIQRIPVSKATANIDMKYTTKTITDEYEMDYVTYEKTKTEKTVVDHKFKMFDKYVMQDIPVLTEEFQLKAIVDYNNSKRDFRYRLPNPPTNDSELYKVSYSFTSVIGGEKHWNIVKTALPVTVGLATSFLLTPAGGAAVGCTVDMALESFGPREGGEPTLVFVAPQSEMNVLNKVTDRDQLFKIINNGSGDTYGAVMTGFFASERLDGNGESLYFQNIDILKAKNLKINVSATYYAPLFKPVIAKEHIYTPIFKENKAKEKIKISREVKVPYGVTQSATGESYVLVEYPDTMWSLNYKYVPIQEDIVKVVPRMSRMKSQVTQMSEIIYSQSFSAVSGQPLAAKIRLPKPINDEYQTMKYKKLKYTLVVSEETYKAFKKQMSIVIKSGLTYGIGKGTGKIASKAGKAKPAGDESMNTVEKILDVKDQYEQTTEIIETAETVDHIAKTGKEKEEEPEEAFFVKNGKSANTVLHKVGATDADVTEYIPEAMMKLKIPSVSDISDGIADKITPHIKDQIYFKITAADQTQKVYYDNTVSYLSGEIPLKDNFNFNFLIKNPRSKFDWKNFVSNYIHGSLIIELEYELTNYKDMLIFDEVRSTVDKGYTLPVQEYKVVKRKKYVPKSEVKSWYKVIK